MADTKKMALISTQGTLDWAYPPFILGSTAAALGYEVQIFFTFYGLQLLKRKLNLKISPLGNPGMPMPLGMHKWFPVLGTAIPGMETLMTGMMKSKMRSKGIASVEELRDICLESDVKLIACQMTGVGRRDVPRSFVRQREHVRRRLRSLTLHLAGTFPALARERRDRVRPSRVFGLFA